MLKVVSGYSVAACLILCRGAGLAQTARTGGAGGTVLDERGRPVRAVMITLGSDQISRTLTTDAQGQFLIHLLNPGIWRLTAHKPGFQTLTLEITIHTDEFQNLRIRLLPEASVTVEVATEALDQTTTQTGLAISQDRFQALPISRDFNSLVLLAPGAVDGGGNFGGRARSNTHSIAGASGAENAYYLEGLNTTDLRYGFQSLSVKPEFIDQVEVQTGGFKPEYSALGGVVVAVLKSGSNAFKGSAWMTWDPASLSAIPKGNATFTPQGIGARYDGGFEVGGPILRDRVFYFVGVDTGYQSAPGLPNHYPGLIASTATTHSLDVATKVNWYLNTDQQWTNTLTYQGQTLRQDRLYPDVGTANLAATNRSPLLTFGSNFEWTLSSNLFLSLQGGATRLDDPIDPVDSITPLVRDDLYFTELGPGGAVRPDLAGRSLVSGGYGQGHITRANGTTQFRADLSWILGSHSLKFGASHLASWYRSQFDADIGINFAIRSGPLGLPMLVVRQGSQDAAVKATYEAFYAQDVWQATPGLRLFYGIRYETQSQAGAQGKTFLRFQGLKDYAQPRLGFTWDAWNDGRSKLSGSYGVYFETIPQRLALLTFGDSHFFRREYWTSSGKFIYDPNAQNHYGTVTPANLDPTQADNRDKAVDYGSAGYTLTIADGTKLPRRREFNLGFDQVVGTRWTFGLHVQHRELGHALEDSVIADRYGNPVDPGPDGSGANLLWNPGPSVTWTSSSVSQTPNQRYTVPDTFIPKGQNTYDRADLALEWRSTSAFLGSSYTWSRLKGNYEGLVSSSNGQPDANLTASFDYWPYVGTGLLPLDRTHVIKAYGSTRIPIGPHAFVLGFTWSYQSGVPKNLFDDGSTTNGYAPGWDSAHVVYLTSSTVSGNPVAVNTDAAYRNPANYDGSGNWIGPMSLTHPFLDIGHYGGVPAHFQLGQYGRAPATNLVNVHFGFEWSAGGQIRVIPSLDVFNLFNTRDAMSLNNFAAGGNGNQDPSYGQPTAYQAGRRLRLGLRIRF